MSPSEAFKIIAVSTLINALVSTAITLAMWAPQGLGLRAQRPTFATLDVAQLYRLQESQAAAVLVRSDSSPAQRTTALQRAASFGSELERLMQTLAEQCHCLVLTAGAVAASGSELVDLTPDARRRLGL